MKKRIILTTMIALCMCLLTACGCEHEWIDADCLTPKTCALCDKTEGSALGHTWEDPTCMTPKLCTSCGLKEGDPLPHTPGDWITHASYDTAEYHKVNLCAVCSTAADEEVIPMTTFVDGSNFIFSPMDVIYRICSLFPGISSANPIYKGSSVDNSFHAMQVMSDEEYNCFMLSFFDENRSYIPITIEGMPNEADGTIAYVLMEVSLDFQYEEILFKTFCPGITPDEIEARTNNLKKNIAGMSSQGAAMVDEYYDVVYFTNMNDDTLGIIVIPIEFWNGM